MLANRFDNLSVEDLIAREEETRVEREAVIAALKQRLLTACPVEIGKVYRFRKGLMNAHGKPSWLRTRRLLVGYLTVEKPHWSSDQWHVNVQGFLSNPRSTTGDGYNRKSFVLHSWDKLDLSSAENGPRQFGE